MTGSLESVEGDIAQIFGGPGRVVTEEFVEKMCNFRTFTDPGPLDTSPATIGVRLFESNNELVIRVPKLHMPGQAAAYAAMQMYWAQRGERPPHSLYVRADDEGQLAKSFVTYQATAGRPLQHIDISEVRLRGQREGSSPESFTRIVVNQPGASYGSLISCLVRGLTDVAAAHGEEQAGLKVSAAIGSVLGAQMTHSFVELCWDAIRASAESPGDPIAPARALWQRLTLPSTEMP